MRPVHLFAATSLLLLPALSGCVLPEQIDGSGHELRETRDVSTFSAVHVADSLEATITLAPDAPQNVEVSGDDNLVPHVRTRVEGDTLILDLTPNINPHPKLPLVVTVSAEALSAVAASDSAHLVANRVEGEAVSVSASDSAELTVKLVTAEQDLTAESQDSAALSISGVTLGGKATITASDSASLIAKAIAAEGALSVEARDSSEIVLAGEAPSLTIEVSDSSHVDADSLKVADVTVVGSSSSEADVCATDSLDVTLSDSSEVRFTCDPDSITKHIDNSSTLIEK